MKILHVASEAAPYSQTGGLGQVAGSLPAAIAERGHEVALLSPLHAGAAEALAAAGAAPIDTGLALSPVLGGLRFDARILAVRDFEIERLFVDCPALYDRDGLYGHGDDALRFAALALAAREVALARGFDAVHAHDWQAGLVCPYLRQRPALAPRLIFTIHNLAHQGVFPKDLVVALGLEWSMFTPEGFELWDQLSFLKAGAAFADVITTVSPSYAAEIQTPEHGHGLNGFFAANASRLAGVLNGIDTAEWNPAHDSRIAAPFDAGDRAGKTLCRRALADELGMELDAGDLLLGAVSRLAEQKGLDLVADLVPDLGELGARLVVLGSGDGWLERRFQILGDWFPDRLAARIGFDEGLAHRIFAGCDAFVMPSRFEPCGLGQMIAMRYGTVPVTSAVGGLLDTIEDPGDEGLRAGRGNGVRYFGGGAGDLWGAIGRAAALRRDRPAWEAVQGNGMNTDWSWSRAAGQYIELYGGP